MASARSPLVAVFCCLLGAAPLAAQQVASVQLSHRSVTLKLNGRQQVYATAYDAAGGILVALRFSWTSDDPAIVRVEPNPEQTDLATLVAAAEGATRITATVGGRTEAMLVRVERGPAPSPQATPAMLRIEPANIHLLPAESRQLRPLFLREDGGEASPVPVSWTTLNPSVVSVNEAGIVVGVSEGGAVIELRAGALTTRASVEVAVVPFGFAVPVLSLSPGAEQAVVVVVPSQENRVLPNSAFSWRSSDETVVRVTPLGVTRAVGPGRAILIAAGLGQTRQLDVSVHRPVVELEVSPPYSRGPITVPLNGTQRFTARSLAGDGTDVPEAPVLWTVKDTTVAHIDPATGALTGKALGRTELVVTGAAPGLDVRWQIDVIAGGVLVVPGRTGLSVGDTLPLVVSFTDETGNPLGPASGIEWTSLDPAVVQVTQSGLISAVGPGRAAVVASAAWGRADTAVVFVGGRVLFTSTRGGSADLFAVDPETPGRLQQITRDPASETMGSFSPDGASIVYVADRDGRFDLYVANADGSEPRRLTDTPGVEITPRFTAGGRTIVYALQGPNGSRAQIWSMNADGTDARALTAGDAANFEPAPSPDGRLIAFTSTRDGNYEVYLMNVDGTDQRPARVSPLKESRPNWFPNGDIAYVQERGQGNRIAPVVVRLQGAAETPLTPATLAVTDFAVSGDGRMLALEVSAFGQGGGLVKKLVLFPLDGRAPVEVPRTGDAEQQSSPAFRPPRVP